MSESKDGGNWGGAPHLDVSEDKMYDSRLRGDYDLHDMVHSPNNQDRQQKVWLKALWAANLFEEVVFVSFRSWCAGSCTHTTYSI